MPSANKNEEELRLAEQDVEPFGPWEKWGTYVAERAWGTVREDYSVNGDAWNYLPFDLAQSQAYRWGEDGIAGLCDRYQILIFSPVFWNGKDPILKERLFGLNSTEGNHGEDVKEVYYYLDALPSYAYMKYLYKYPQEAFPYAKLKEENLARSSLDSEYELIDTGIFNQGRYFDIVIEYAKLSPEDICIRIEAWNRGDLPADLYILPHLWFRNQWAWGKRKEAMPTITTRGKDCLVADEGKMASPAALGFEYRLGKRYLYGPEGGEALFTDNETRRDGEGFYKDGFHRKFIGEEPATNPSGKGTKACLSYFFPKIPPGKSEVLLFRFSPEELQDPLGCVEEVIAKRLQEADEFYAQIHPKLASDEEKKIQRQAFAGLIWNRQIYLFDVQRWLDGDNPALPPPLERLTLRNVHWRHLNSMRILMMPDKWEYPWFAAWDHAFHCIAISLVDREFAKKQFWLLLFDQFQHPNGQIPAYEWEFSDLNPPVQGWTLWWLYSEEKRKTGKGDRVFLEKCFHKLLMNFSWWVNKVDNSGNNVFEGGFLGMDNISVLDRSQKLGEGITLQQSDGTGWMAVFCLNLMRIALELAKEDSVYEALVTKFFEHYVYIGHAMKQRGNQNYELWSEKDRFFYDVLTYPDGKFEKFRVRSMVGIIPFYAIELLTEEELSSFPHFEKDFFWFLKNRQDLVSQCIIPFKSDKETRYALTLMSEQQMKSVLEYMWNPEEFRAQFGMRSLSKYHEKHPFSFQTAKVGYEPAESREKIKGGNSNWRGPIWFPTNYILIETLKKIALAAPKEFFITAPHENGVNLEEMAESFSRRLINIFLKDQSGRRPFWGENFPFAHDPNWTEHLQFYEYFHPDTGKGLGASHQTGWSALIANLIDELSR